MFKNEIKKRFKNPLNLLWLILLPVYWFLGTNVVRQNIETTKQMAQTVADRPNVSAEARAAVQAAADGVNGFMVFSEGIAEFYVTIAIALLVGILFSASFVYDKNTGFGNFILTRTQFKRYYISKAASVFLSSFFMIFAVLTLILFSSLIAYSATTPTEAFNFSMISGAPLTKLFLSHHWLACFIMIFTLSIFGGLYSLLGMGVSLITSNRFVICVSPLAILLFCTIFPQLFSIQSSIAKVIAWIFPSYFTSMFIGNEFWYTKLPVAAVYFIHLAVIAVPTMFLLFLLYRKNQKQYIR